MSTSPARCTGLPRGGHTRLPLTAGGNKLSGSISGECTNPDCTIPGALKYLSFASNSLSGNLPERWLRSLPGGLRTLRLEDNALSGTLNERWGFPYQIQVLNLSGNVFEGPLPRWWQRQEGELGAEYMRDPPLSYRSLFKLQALDLSRNRIHGSIPGRWILFHGMERLLLGSNLLSGTLPALGIPSTLQLLALENNNLVGPIPPQWAQLGSIPPSLAQLLLHNNSLTGEWRSSFYLILKAF